MGVEVEILYLPPMSVNWGPLLLIPVIQFIWISDNDNQARYGITMEHKADNLMSEREQWHTLCKDSEAHGSPTPSAVD